MVRLQSQDNLRIGCHPIAATLCLVFFFLVGCGTEKSQPDGLTKIATDVQHTFERLDAVEKLNDQAFLTMVALEDKDAIVRLAAVKKLTDQAVLAKIAVEDMNAIVRRAAAEKLTDQAMEPGDREAATPVTEEGPTKTEAPESPPLELAEVKSPAEEEAPIPQVTVEPEEIIVEQHKEASDVAKPSVSYEKTPWSRCVVLTRMNVRQGPSISSKIVGKLNENDEFQVIEEAPNNDSLEAWYLIRAKSGLSGWLCGIYKGNVKFRSIRQTPSTPEMPPGGTFTINLASFRQKQTADRYIEELKHLGIDAHSREVNLPEKGRWYRVSVGGFPTLKKAKNYKKQLRQKGISESFITKITE